MPNKFNPLVSIIIPVFNGANYMREAIDSAINQTYKNIEIIVVNDGSTDETEKIAKSYGDKIRYIKKENGGVASALNLAIKNSKGEYISWLSHDDVYSQIKIEKQIEVLKKKKNKNTIIYSDFCEIDSEGRLIRYINLSKKTSDFMRVFLAVESATYLQGCSLLIPKKLFYKYGFFDLNRICTQDYFQWFKFAKHVDFVKTNYKLVKTRIHDQQESATKLNKKIKESDFLRTEFIKNLTVTEFINYVNGNPKHYWSLYFEYKKSGYKLIPLMLLEKIYKSFGSKKLIPKKIHYIWFGKNEFSDLNKICIESWKKYAPDYEIIKWDESNCNINENKYVKEAYINKKWAFVSDYFRFKILKENGGFYADTDIEFNRNIDELRFNQFFIGFERKTNVNPGFFGAMPNSPIINQILNTYKNEGFIKNKKLNTKKTSPIRVTNLLHKQFKLELSGKEQFLKQSIRVYPMNVLTIDVNDGENIVKHHFTNSWQSINPSIPYPFILTKMFFKDLIFGNNISSSTEKKFLDNIYIMPLVGHLIVRIYLKIKKIFMFIFKKYE